MHMNDIVRTKMQNQKARVLSIPLIILSPTGSAKASPFLWGKESFKIPVAIRRS